MATKNQKRVATRFSVAPARLEGRTWQEARSQIQDWMETATSILDGLATSRDLDEHNGLNGLQGGSIEERYHFTLSQHSYLASHQSAVDPHTQYQKESEKGMASGYASLDAGGLVPVAQLATGTPDGTKFLRDDRTLQNVPPDAHNSTTGLQGGTTAEYYHLTSAEHAALLAVLGYLLTGTGDPEGAVTASVGTLFLRQDGGAGTTLYVKESGTGNTGWAAK